MYLVWAKDDGVVFVVNVFEHKRRSGRTIAHAFHFLEKGGEVHRGIDMQVQLLTFLRVTTSSNFRWIIRKYTHGIYT